MPLLEAHFTMVYLDPIGTGASGRLPTHPMGYSVDRFAGQLLALLDAVGIDRPTLLGHSHGAFVILEAALRRPDAMAGLLLYAGAASTGGGFMAAAAARIDDFVRRHRDTSDAESVRAGRRAACVSPTKGGGSGNSSARISKGSSRPRSKPRAAASESAAGCG